MKTNNFLSIATAAVATAALTVVIFGGGSMEAGNDSAAPGTPVAQPKLAIKGVELSLVAADSRLFHAGEQPAFELKAVNTTGQPADVDVTVAMTAASPGSMYSRVVRMPVCLWTTTETLKLDARETKTLTLNARTNLPANSLITVSMSDPTSLPAGNVYGNVSVAGLSNPTLALPSVPVTVGNSTTFPISSIVALRFSTVTNVVPGSQSNLTAAR